MGIIVQKYGGNLVKDKYVGYIQFSNGKKEELYY